MNAKEAAQATAKARHANLEEFIRAAFCTIKYAVARGETSVCLIMGGEYDRKAIIDYFKGLGYKTDLNYDKRNDEGWQHYLDIEWKERP